VPGSSHCPNSGLVVDASGRIGLPELQTQIRAVGSGLTAVWVVRHTVRTLKSDESEQTAVLLPTDSQSNRANFDEATCETSWHVLDSSVEDLLRSLP